jgi:hypothetical protein
MPYSLKIPLLPSLTLFPTFKGVPSRQEPTGLDTSLYRIGKKAVLKSAHQFIGLLSQTESQDLQKESAPSREA